MKQGFSAICRNGKGEIKVVDLGAHADAVKARRHAELTIGGRSLAPLAVVPSADAERTAKRWRERRPLPA